MKKQAFQAGPMCLSTGWRGKDSTTRKEKSTGNCDKDTGLALPSYDLILFNESTIIHITKATLIIV